jgi:hypothetical protein
VVLKGKPKVKESLKEQLARLAKSGTLNPSDSIARSPVQEQSLRTNRVDTQASQRNLHGDEKMVLELDKLRSVKSSLTNEINQLRATSSANAAELQVQISDLKYRLESTEKLNNAFAEENRRLEQQLASMPNEETIQGWRERTRQAEQLIHEADESIKQLERDRQLLASDRSAFEDQLARLDQLDSLADHLATERLQFAAAEDDARMRASELEKTEKKLGLERSRLEKLSVELHKLQENVGRYKGIERAMKALEAEHLKVSKLYEASKTRVRNLTTERDHAREAHATAESMARKVSRELRDSLSKLSSLPDGEVVIRSFETVQWLTSQFDDPDEQIVPKQVLLIGEGPWPIDDFTELLRDLGFDVWQDGCNADIEVVIVGRENWSESVINAQIEEREGESLRIYPQELFVLLLAMQADPLIIADTDALLRFVGDHPAFEYLLNQEFPWPESAFEDEPPATINEGFKGDDVHSPLYKMGYSVAQQVALSTSRRHEILEKSYAEKNLPWCISDEYMEDWGEATSRKRLRRIAWHLHLMTKRFRRHTEAVSRWKADLDWLKQNYYKPIHRFRWPS